MSPLFRFQFELKQGLPSNESNMRPSLSVQKHLKTLIPSRRGSNTTADTEDDVLSLSSSDFLPIDQCILSRPPAEVIGDKSCLAGRYLKSCFVDKTRRSASIDLTVRFDKVEFREYGVILSDNPCTFSGPPIGLGWLYDPNDTLESDIDSYENQRLVSGSRRPRCALRLPVEVRIEMLLKAGHTFKEIHAACERVQEERERRYSSLRYRNYDLILERAEMFKKSAQRMTLKRSVKSTLNLKDLR